MLDDRALSISGVKRMVSARILWSHDLLVKPLIYLSSSSLVCDWLIDRSEKCTGQRLISSRKGYVFAHIYHVESCHSLVRLQNRYQNVLYSGGREGLERDVHPRDAYVTYGFLQRASARTAVQGSQTLAMRINQFGTLSPYGELQGPWPTMLRALARN